MDDNGRPDLNQIARITEDIARLRNDGFEVILVSSGAIAAGVQAMGLLERPTQLPELQMAAAVGQSVLMNHYTNSFAKHNCQVGQILLTHADLNNRERHLNTRNTMQAMIRNGIIPIVNENDVVAVDEIRFGDNDVLASMVSTLIDGDLLLLLTTSDGFFRMEKGEMTERIPEIGAITNDILAMAKGKGSNWSSGGMASKLEAAKHAAIAGTPVIIANGLDENIIQKAIGGEDVGTLLLAGKQSIKARKKWIAFFHKPQGTITVDDGAEIAICEKGNSLLPIGVHNVDGRFSMGSLINIKNRSGEVIARGLSAFSKEDVEKIKGRHTAEIAEILGQHQFTEVVHRDNMVLMKETNVE